MPWKCTYMYSVHICTAYIYVLDALNVSEYIRCSWLIQLNWLHESLTFSASGIDCFKCVSINGTNPSCEDPFHNNYTSKLLERPCMGGRKGRNGLFPASACIKVSGTYGKSKKMIFLFCYWKVFDLLWL